TPVPVFSVSPYLWGPFLGSFFRRLGDRFLELSAAQTADCSFQEPFGVTLTPFIHPHPAVSRPRTSRPALTGFSLPAPAAAILDLASREIHGCHFKPHRATCRLCLAPTYTRSPSNTSQTIF
ncbi:Hypothetical predicted protein, partial [Pelobates cultripes]